MIDIITQNLRGCRSGARLEERWDALRNRHVFAACVQEAWRNGEENVERDGGHFLGSGLSAHDQSRRGSQGVAIVLSATAVAAWVKTGA